MKNINDIDFEALSDEERSAVLQIMNEIADKGSSDKYTDILYQDYKEIPVDILTFIKDPRYLGKAWHLSDGECKLYPYWEDKLQELFPDNISTSVNNFILSGARGLGKSEIAVTVMAYLMYRVMCLKNPLEYFGLKPTERIAFSFMNITEALAYDIGVSKFQNTIQMSPWFMERGTLSGKKDLVWNPPPYINIIIGSQPRHVIGQACLTGDTKILTTDGYFCLEELVDKQISVLSRADDGTIVQSDNCTVKPTVITNEEYTIELEDGTVIRCTPNHKFLLKSGKYVEAKDLSETDEIVDFKPFGYIYKCTHPYTGKIYIGKRESEKVDLTYYGSGKKWVESISNVDTSLIDREILAWGSSRKELNELEIRYIREYDATNPDVGYNIHRGGQGGNSLNDFQLWSQLHKGVRNGRYGMIVSEETRKKIGDANRGKVRTEEAKLRISLALKGIKRSEEQKRKISEAQKGSSHNISEDGLRKLREANARNIGCIVYNNGKKDIRVRCGQVVPEGFVKGSVRKSVKTERNNVKGRRWYHNDHQEVYIKEDPPPGFIPGRCNKVKNRISETYLLSKKGGTPTIEDKKD